MKGTLSKYKVYETTNYSMFKRLDGNRKVLEARVKKIISSMVHILSKEPWTLTSTYRYFYYQSILHV